MFVPRLVQAAPNPCTTGKAIAMEDGRRFMPAITRAFTGHGLQLRPDAASHAAMFVASEISIAQEASTGPISIPQEVKAAVDSLIGALKRDSSSSSRGAVSTIIDAPSVLAALDAIRSSRALADAAAIAGGPLQLMLSTQDGSQRPATRGESELLEQAREGAIDKRFFQVVDAYAMPSVEFAASRQAFVHTKRDRSLHGAASEKSKMFLDRRTLLEQRIRRDPRFITASMGNNAADIAGGFEISRIESLIGESGECCILGMLTEGDADEWFIEGESASIKVDLSALSTPEGLAGVLGLFMDHCFVLAQGTLSNDVFHVTTLASPPAESRELTLKAFPVLDLCGTQPDLTALQRHKDVMTQALTQYRTDDSIFVLTEVHLDDEKTLARLGEFFAGVSQMERPPVIVLVGAFASPDFLSRTQDLGAYEALFDRLAKLVAQHENVANNAHIVLVPSASDPGASTILPLPSLPPLYLRRLRRVAKHVTAASNPARLIFFGKEICIFRGDVQKRFRRAAVLTQPTPDTAAFVQLVAQTVCDQAHLSPLPLTQQPIVWSRDAALRLYPLPDFLVLADVVEMTSGTYKGCVYSTTGTFSETGEFACIVPAQGIVEKSGVA